ncbi:hypothetical protein ABZ357_21380 [Streptomyces sp. NPDC005917]|uniref:hypothetical protein n=1 Tax=unclassified Streptomyces TaxID=2593676 RepID=UPI0033CBA262
MSRRPYNLSPEGRARLANGAAKSRAHLDAPSRLITKLEEAAESLSLEERDRLAGVIVRNTPNRTAPLPPETAQELARLFGGGSQ